MSSCPTSYRKRHLPVQPAGLSLSQICQMPRPHAHTRTHARTDTHVSLLPHLSVGQSPIFKTKPPLSSASSLLHYPDSTCEPLSLNLVPGILPVVFFFKKQTNKQKKKEPALLQPPCCSSRQHGNCLTNALNECVSFSSYQFVSSLFSFCSCCCCSYNFY